jgi:hypothetical protein
MQVSPLHFRQKLWFSNYFHGHLVGQCITPGHYFLGVNHWCYIRLGRVMQGLKSSCTLPLVRSLFSFLVGGYLELE